jgi:hypothetical protein
MSKMIVNVHCTIQNNTFTQILIIKVYATEYQNWYLRPRYIWSRIHVNASATLCQFYQKIKCKIIRNWQKSLTSDLSTHLKCSLFYLFISSSKLSFDEIHVGFIVQVLWINIRNYLILCITVWGDERKDSDARNIIDRCFACIFDTSWKFM